MSSRYKKIAILSIILSSVAFILLFNCKTVLYTDDYVYSVSLYDGKLISKLSQVMPSFYQHVCFTRTNPRLANLFVMMFLIPDKSVFNIINSIAYTSLILTIYFHIRGTFKKFSCITYLIVFVSLFVLTPAFGQDYLWISGSANYLYSILFVLLLLIPFRNYYNHQESLKNKNALLKALFFVVFFVSSFVVSLMHEQSTVIFVTAQICFMISYKIKGNSLKPWMFAGAVASSLGFILIAIKSMGRLKKDGGISVMTILKNLVQISVKYLAYLAPLIIGITALLVLIYKNSQKCKKRILSFIKVNDLFLIYFITSLASSCFLTVVPVIPIRAWGMPVLLTTLSFGILINSIPVKYHKLLNYKKSIIIIIVVSIACFGSYTSLVYNRVDKVAKEFYAREAYIEAQKSKGIYDIKVPSIDGISGYDVYYYADGFDVSADKNNLDMAKYYGVSSILRK